jgi:hypothetical protein
MFQANDSAQKSVHPGSSACEQSAKQLEKISDEN